MKKFIIAGVLASVVGVASAVEVSVGGAYDYKAEQFGTRVAVSAGKIGPVTPNASVTYINNVYTRYAVGGDVSLVSLGPVKLGAGVSGVYQDSYTGQDGYGVTAGLKANYDVTKNISVTGGVERFYGQDRIKSSNGTVASLAVSYKF